MTKTGPNWTELVDEAARIMGFSEPELLRARGTDLQILEYFRIISRGFTPLTIWLHSNMNPPSQALLSSSIHTELALLNKCNLFYTTNYDNFIERSFQLNEREFRVVAMEQDMGFQTDIAEIIKFHGDMNHPETMVLSESDYETRLKLDSPMDYRLSADVLGRVILFLGYSFRDWNVSYLFRLVNEKFQNSPLPGTGRRAYIVVPDPSNFEIELFRARNIDVIPIRGGSMEEDITNILRELRGA